MTLQQFASSHQVDVQQLTTSQEPSGGELETWTTSHTTACRIQPLSAQEQRQAGQPGANVTHRIYFTSDPQLTPRHRLVYQSRLLYPITTRNVDEQDRLWVVTAEERTPPVM